MLKSYAAPSVETQNDRITTNFRCVQGLMHGYSQTTSEPTKKNVAAMLRDLASQVEYAQEGPDPSWEEILELVERFPRSFVANYADGNWPRG